MTKNEIIYAPATLLARAIQNKEVSSETVVSTYLERALAVNTDLNCVLQIAPESALAQAKAADAALSRGAAIGPLHGVPFTVKDVFAVSPEIARLEPAPGMAQRPDPEQPAQSSTAVQRLREAGAILMGVTRATLWSDREERYGIAHNPYDLKRTPSGSSGGEAALIAAGGSPLGLGSDSGGSLRLPAHCCGIATIRPSNGRVPRATDADGTNDPRTAAGPLARNVDDIALALQIISGFDWREPTTLPLPPPGDHRAVSLRDLRVAFFTDNGIAPPTRETAAMIHAAARSLELSGAQVTESVPPLLAESWEITNDYWRYCGEQGEVAGYFRFLERWDRYRMALLAFMQQWDALLCPTEAFPAPLTNEPSTPPMFTYTAPFSLLGWPCAVVRGGTCPDGMPLTVQVIGAPWRDDIALALAHALETALGGYRPPRL